MYCNIHHMWYDATHIYDRTHVYIYIYEKREFDLEGGLVGAPHTWYLSAQSFITLLKL